MIFRRGYFRGDWLPGDEQFEGWTTGETWNGWALPYFEFEESRRYAELQTRLAAEHPEWRLGTVSYDVEADAFVVANVDEPGDPEVWPAEEIEVDGEVRKVYGLGAGFWTWEQVEPAESNGTSQ
jgi:hypothetical protein